MCPLPRVVLPALGRFHTQCTEGLFFNLQVLPTGICTNNLPTLPSLNVSTWLSTRTHHVLSADTAESVQTCMRLCTCIHQCVRSQWVLRPGAETHRAVAHSGIGTVIYSGRLVRRAHEVEENRAETQKTKNFNWSCKYTFIANIFTFKQFHVEIEEKFMIQKWHSYHHMTLKRPAETLQSFKFLVFLVVLRIL